MYSCCFVATALSKVATCLFAAFAIPCVLLSSQLPGTSKALQIKGENWIQIARPKIRSIFSTSIARLPRIITQHSYEPTHKARVIPKPLAILCISPNNPFVGADFITLISSAKLSSMTGKPIVKS